MHWSDTINELAGALAKAQANTKGALKGSTNPHFKSKYADLESVVEACLPALNAAGIAVIQSPETDGQRVTVVTLLTHSSGQWVKGEASAEARDAGPQAIGSCITYLRRYALAAMAGVAPEDDDGEAAERPANKKALTMPDGFSAWWAKLQTCATRAELRESWSAADAAWRDYATRAKASELEALKRMVAQDEAAS